jgi:RimJ/RimL family protein N-acetyltransferase
VVVDRIEIAYAVRSEEATLRPPRAAEVARPGTEADLEPLVVAARESLREEQRPDPFAGDANGFRRWVRGRVRRARVVESRGRIHFAGYADVCRREGWLIQGVYTWPEVRRHGYATTGISYMCQEAFAAGADHVQLAVVEDNIAGRALYRRLGFSPFAKLRTILFA